MFPQDLELSFVESALAIASIYTNGLSLVVGVVAVAAVLCRKRLGRSQQYIFILAATIALLMLVGNEFAPLVIARRIRYTIVLALPWVCALALGLSLIPGWRYLRVPFLIVWFAASVAYSNSDDLLRYTNWLNLNLHKVPPYHDLFYEPGLDIEPFDYIVSFHPDTIVDRNVHRFYDRFPGRWMGLIHIWENSDGEPQVWTSDTSYRSIESMQFWRSRVWLVYNPEQTDPDTISTFSDGFEKYYRSCGRYVEKSDSVIELYGPKDISCEALIAEASPAMHIEYDNGSTLRHITFGLDADQLTASMWWSRTKHGIYSYSLQVFDQAGAKTGPQTDGVIDGSGLYNVILNLSSLTAGEYVLKLIVYNYDSLQSQPGTVVGPGHQFQRDVEVGSFNIEG